MPVVKDILCKPNAPNSWKSLPFQKDIERGRFSPSLENLYHICLNEKSKEKGGELHGFLNTLLSPRMNAARKKEVLLRDYGVEMEQEIGEELKQMCNLSEAIEEYAMREGVRKGVRKGISLTKNIMRLAGEGKSEEEISALCGVSAKMVREIMKA